MRLILTANVDSLGSIGEIVKVKPGYGETTFTSGLAVPANEGNEASLKNQLKVLEKKRSSTCRS